MAGVLKQDQINRATEYLDMEAWGFVDVGCRWACALRLSNLRRNLSLRREFVLSLVRSELDTASEENKDRDQYRHLRAKEGKKEGGEAGG